MRQFFSLFLVLFTLGGCAGPSVEPLMPTPVVFSELETGPLDHIDEDRRWKPRRVYYATTRARRADLQRIEYGNDESEALSLGLALIGFGGPQISWSDLNRYSRQAQRSEMIDLSVAGLLEAGRIPLRAPTTDGSPDESAAWLLADMNASIEAARDKDLLIYVHGAKVNFYNANAFAAQLDHFMGRDMTSLAFAWPTRQNILAYGSGDDVARAYRAADALTQLLELLAERSAARRIHVVCWSAGGRVLNSAVRQLHDRHAGRGEDIRQKLRLGTLYFAAADVPGEEFLDALPALNATADRVVVTLSSNDGALKMAERFMGQGRRIGQAGVRLEGEQLDRVLAADRLEVVDVSRGWEGRGFDITGHRYWIDHPWASSDLILAVRGELDPAERALAPTRLPLLWTLPSDYPARLREKLAPEVILDAAEP